MLVQTSTELLQCKSWGGVLSLTPTTGPGSAQPLRIQPRHRSNGNPVCFV